MILTIRRSALLATLALLAFAATASAASITVQPSASALSSLDHYYAYEWVVTGFQVPVGESITSATLTLTDIYNWQDEPFSFYTHLLDQQDFAGTYPNGYVRTFYDNQASGDFFVGDGVQAWAWSGSAGGWANRTTLSYSIDPANFGYLVSGGTFAIAIDPDCHFYNSGVSLTVETAPAVPEPASLLLLGTGLAGLVRFARRRSR